MKRYILERFSDHEGMGVFGRLLWQDSAGATIELFTVECPWLDNKPYASCVPAGDYELVPYESPSYGLTLALKNHALDVGVLEGQAKRFACLFHPANRAHEVEGCIGPGLYLGAIGPDWAVLESAAAFEKFANAVEPGDIMTIIWKSHP